MSLGKLHPRLQDLVKDQKWTDLTPIQKKAFDPIYNYKSCIIEAPTSGGKTEAVLFPLLTRIAENKNTGFKVLYIAPLKALLNDLALRVIPYARRCYLEAFKWHGDVDNGAKVEQMLFPSDILLTTPESIEAILLRRGNWKDAFANLETIVIDEAHYFALTERGSHLISLLERIECEIQKCPQRIAVSATIGNPEELLVWLLGTRGEGQSIQVINSKEKERDFKIQYFDEEGITMQFQLYHQLLSKKSIVFVRSRTGTESTAAEMIKMNDQVNPPKPLKVRTHHSSVSKRLREEAEQSIKQATETSVDAIISTSTLELGIDIGDLNQVIQIGGLNSSGSFLQRVGRTGRREGQKQIFRGMCSDPDELILLIGCVDLGWRKQSEAILFPHKAFHILAHQIICLSLQKMGVTLDTAWSILSKAACFSEIKKSQAEDLVQFMLAEEYLRKVEHAILIPGPKSEKEFLGANWKRLFAIFDTGQMYNVVDNKRIIGTLDASFAKTLKMPFVFVLGGHEWSTKKIDHELQQIIVEKNRTGIAPKWKSIATHDIPFELAQEVGKLLMNNDNINYLDEKAHQEFQRQRNNYSGLKWKAGNWVIESSMEDDAAFIIWNFWGDKINRALSMLLENRLGFKPDSSYQNITIEKKKKLLATKENVSGWLSEFRNSAPEQLQKQIIEKFQASWFSKFSKCLPDNLAKEAILEKSCDFDGLVRELNRQE